MMSKKQRDDYGQSSGLAKFFHKLVMFILLPFRKPIPFIIILAVLYVAPVFLAKVELAKVHLWYKDKIVALFYEAQEKFNEKTAGLAQQGPVIEERTSEKIVDLPRKMAATRRKMFEKSKVAPNTIDVLAMTQSFTEQAVIEEDKVEEVLAPEVEVDTSARKIALKFVKQPFELSGAARVKNANEILVGEDLVILYGIYVDPLSVEGMKAEEFLREMIVEDVTCTIEAYTMQDIATGICTVAGQNINRALINQGLSKNILLK